MTETEAALIGWEGEGGAVLLEPEVNRAELVGPGEIAERLSVARNTVIQWRLKGWLPEPIGWVKAGGYASKMPIYEWPTVERWARESGRISE